MSTTLADGIISGSVLSWARVGAGAGLGLGIEATLSFPGLDDPTLALCRGCCLVVFFSKVVWDQSLSFHKLSGHLGG